MKIDSDREIVESWLEPVSLHDVLAALRHAGFSGDVYRGCFADLNATRRARCISCATATPRAVSSAPGSIPVA